MGKLRVLMETMLGTPNGPASLNNECKLADEQIPTLDKLGAAPNGFGLGTGAGKVITDANQATSNGWYYHYGSTNSPTVGGTSLDYGQIFVSTCNYNIWQTYYANTAGYHARFLRYSINGGSTWSAWEIIDSPLKVTGLETRTTKRYADKPVYTKLMSVGALPSNAAKTVFVLGGNSINTAIMVLSVWGVATSSGYTNTKIPGFITGLRGGTSPDGTNNYVELGSGGGDSIIIKTNFDAAADFPTTNLVVEYIYL